MKNHINIISRVQNLSILLPDLYHESHENIRVMFASIANFWDFYHQTTISRHGIECLKVLNEIISEFDQVNVVDDETSSRGVRN